MKIQVLGFGIVREIFGASRIEADLPDKPTIGDLRKCLEQRYPQLQKLASYMVARDDQYAQMADAITAEQEIAVIPPVSGG